MLQLKQNVAVRAPVRLLTAAGAPLTGVLASGVVSATLYQSDGSSIVVTVSGNWFETAGGGYQLVVTPTVLGPLQLVVVAGGANTFLGVFDCVANFVSDVVTSANNAATSASGAVTAANAAAASAAATLNALTGGWKLDPILNQLVLYGPDNVTVIATFNLFDSGGLPSVTNVYLRTRI